MLGRIEW